MRCTSVLWNVLNTWRTFTDANSTRRAIDTAEARGAWQPSQPKEQTMSLFSQQLPGLSVGLLRIMFGVLWLDAALQKAPWVINAQGQRFGWLSNWIWQEIQHPTFTLYKQFLETVVFPNTTLNPFFGYMSFCVEMALGVALLLGLFTVLSGIGGALWQLNIAIGSYMVPGEWYWIWPLLIAPHLVFAHSRAGRVLGLDLFIQRWLSKDARGQTALGRFLRRWV
jgi:TQO small subunit DoxD